MHSRLATAVVALIGITSCSGSVIGFDITRSIPEQRVQGDPLAHTAGTLLGTSPVNPFQLQIDLSSEAAAHDSGPIQDVRLRSLTFSITAANEPAGDTDCFDFVDSVTLSVESTQAGTQLQPQVIATVTQPGCVRTLAFDVVNSVNLAPYINEGLRITSNGRGVPPADDVSFDGAITLHAGI